MKSRDIDRLISEANKTDHERRAAFATYFERHAQISKIVGTEDERYWRVLLWSSFETGCNHGSTESLCTYPSRETHVELIKMLDTLQHHVSRYDEMRDEISTLLARAYRESQA